MTNIEVLPAILRATFEGVEEDWKKVYTSVSHLHVDITDGVFAGDGSFREIRRFKQLPDSNKIELHMMVHTPGNFIDDIIDLNPSRCVFHVESFEGIGGIKSVYKKLRANTQAQLSLALNPKSPLSWLEENLDVIDYVMFMGYNPGWAGQEIDPKVYKKISQFKTKYKDIPIAVDGHVGRDTIEPYVKAGATILYANSAVFKEGNPIENLKQLTLLAQAVKNS